MSARRGHPAERPDDENPELTAAEMQRARLASDVLPRLIGQSAAAAVLKRQVGRPPVDDKLLSTTLRIPRSIVEAYRAKGSDWRKRMEDAVKESVSGKT